MSIRSFKPLVGLALALAAGFAHAGRVDFDELHRTFLGRDLGISYDSGGFMFSSIGLLRNPSFLTTADASGETLAIDMDKSIGVSLLTVQRADGGLFDLMSLDLADRFNVGATSEVLVMYTKDGGSVALPLVFDDQRGLQTYDLGIDGIDSFSLFGSAFQLDNVVWSEPAAAVPEPDSWTLVVAGLAMLGTLVRRRRG